MESDSGAPAGSHRHEVQKDLARWRRDLRCDASDGVCRQRMLKLVLVRDIYRSEETYCTTEGWLERWKFSLSRRSNSLNT